MLKALSDFFDRAFAPERDGAASADERRHGVHVATALLLIEVERADFSEDLTAREETLKLLKDRFELSDADATLLVDEAGHEADHAASLQGFTRRLHETLTPDEKLGIVEMLWRVALADAHLDKHEDYLVRKIADLLYVSHGDLIRLRNTVKATAER